MSPEEELERLIRFFKIPDDLRSDTPRALSGYWYSAALLRRTQNKFDTPIFDRLVYERQVARERNGWDMSFLAY